MRAATPPLDLVAERAHHRGEPAPAPPAPELLVTFRSIVIPLKAIVLNLLSVAAAYGVPAWVSRRAASSPCSASARSVASRPGCAVPLCDPVRPVDGLPRVHPHAGPRGGRLRPGHGPPVAHGLEASASVVTSAAVVTVAVFATFGTLSAIGFKEMAVGLAVAVLLDATIVRAGCCPRA